MALFTNDELRLLDVIASGKRLTDDDKELLPSLSEKLSYKTHRPSELLERFVLLTGWANRPKDYPA